MLRTTGAVLGAVLLAGCGGSGSSSGSAAPATTAAPSATASGSASGPLKGSPVPTRPSAPAGQPVTATDGRAFLARFPGAVEAAPAFDPAIVTDLDAALTVQAGDPTSRQIFDTVPPGRPAGVVAQVYLFCPLARGAEQCAVTADDYGAFVDGCATAGGVRVQRLVEQGAGWAAAGVCLTRYPAAKAAAVATDVAAQLTALGLKPTADPALTAIATDWARYRAGQAAPGDFTAVDSPEENGFAQRLKALPSGATLSRAACGAETNPVPTIGVSSLKGLLDVVGPGASLKLGTGAAVGNGRLILVWCFQKQL